MTVGAPGALALVALIGACDGDGAGGPDATSLDAGLPPDASVATGPTRYPADVETAPVTAAVVARMRAIAAAGPGQRDDVFMKVGASGTVSTRFLYCLAGAAHQPAYAIDLAGRDALVATLDHFRTGLIGGATPFDRATLAAEVGRTAAWAITGAPSPLTAELAATTPRFAFVNYGTNDMNAAASYGAALGPFWERMGTLLDQLEAAGVVPILTGLNPRDDDPAAARWVPTWDSVTRALAEARQLPYLSLWVASAPLADHGLLADGLHGNVYVAGGRAEPCVFTPAGLAFNYDVRNLRSLELLDAARRTVLAGEPAPTAPPLAPVVGAGTDADPLIVDRLPFTHSGDTVGGQATHAGYAGCDQGQDEAGPERVYALHLDAPAALRVIALDRAGVDVDVHVLTDGACVERADRLLDRTLPAGDHRIVVDSFVTAAGAQAGAYTLVIQPCAAGDPDC
ncbi:MAG: SGNH/GDSL hydrolase family protein [Kofleriaceae bacterium]|nr:SGNH/GDSL hydrolase family protein [Kofleriaceae bacterium]